MCAHVHACVLKCGDVLLCEKGVREKEVWLKRKVQLGREAEQKGEAESDTGEERDTQRERKKKQQGQNVPNLVPSS